MAVNLILFKTPLIMKLLFEETQNATVKILIYRAVTIFIPQVKYISFVQVHIFHMFPFL